MGPLAACQPPPQPCAHRQGAGPAKTGGWLPGGSGGPQLKMLTWVLSGQEISLTGYCACSGLQHHPRGSGDLVRRPVTHGQRAEGWYGFMKFFFQLYRYKHLQVVIKMNFVLRAAAIIVRVTALDNGTGKSEVLYRDRVQNPGPGPRTGWRGRRR